MLLLHLLVAELYTVSNVSEANAFFDRLAVERGVDCPPPRTTARLLDKVSLTSMRGATWYAG